ncbi:hypothetical protein D3C81_1636860 [compost metagenome]
MAVAPVHQPLVKALQFMTEVAHRADLRQPRTALEGMQVALQGRQGHCVVRVLQPALQRQACALQDVDRLFEKDRHYFVIDACGRFATSEVSGGRGQFGNACSPIRAAANQARCRRMKAFLE